MSKQIYLKEAQSRESSPNELQTLVSQTLADCDLAKELKRLHLQKPIDVVFTESFEPYKVLRAYCDRHKIDRVELGAVSAKDIFVAIFDYLGKNPKAERVFYTGQNEKLPRLAELSRQAGIEVFLV